MEDTPLSPRVRGSLDFAFLIFRTFFAEGGSHKVQDEFSNRGAKVSCDLEIVTRFPRSLN